MEEKVKVNEKASEKKKREWVKTAAIVFLALMLLLTFFSNTIMNYSLPEVAIQYVTSGQITAKIRGGGVVEGGETYDVVVEETRKVASIAVSSGDAVQKGDILMHLEAAEVDGLDEAKTALEQAERAYDTALLSVEVTDDVLDNLESGMDTDKFRDKITTAQKAVKTANEKYLELKEKFEQYDIELNTNGISSTMLAEVRAYKQAESDLEDKQEELEDAEAAFNRVYSVSSGDARVDSLADAVKTAQRRVNSAQSTYNQKKTALNNKKADAEKKMNDAEETLKEKQEALTELTGNIAQTLNLESLNDAVLKAQQKVAELQAKSEPTVVKADIAGTVLSIDTAAGRVVSPLAAVAVLQPAGEGFTLSFSVTNEQAKKVSVGDMAELVNSWYYSDMEVRLAAIKPDTSDPGQKKLLVFSVTGDNVVAGQTLNISVGQKSANYDLIIPNSAIREDNNGKFVLVVQAKSSPLGNRYIATRVDIEVLASDDTQSAVKGALYGNEYVITTATKPVEAGDQVRLSEN